MYIRQLKYRTFFEWLRSPIETLDGMVYDGNNSNPITHANFVSSVFYDIDQILQNNNYHLDNVKLFKSELANIIYKFSDHGKYGPL